MYKKIEAQAKRCVSYLNIVYLTLRFTTFVEICQLDGTWGGGHFPPPFSLIAIDGSDEFSSFRSFQCFDLGIISDDLIQIIFGVM